MSKPLAVNHRDVAEQRPTPANRENDVDIVTSLHFFSLAVWLHPNPKPRIKSLTYRCQIQNANSMPPFDHREQLTIPHGVK